MESYGLRAKMEVAWESQSLQRPQGPGELSAFSHVGQNRCAIFSYFSAQSGAGSAFGLKPLSNHGSRCRSSKPPSHFVGQGDGGAIVTPEPLDLQSPRSESIGLGMGLGGVQGRSSAMDKEHAHIDVAAFADRAESSPGAAGMLLGSQADIAGEMSGGGEATNVPHHCDECGGGEQTDARDGFEARRCGDLRSQGAELEFDLPNPLLEIPDLLDRFGESGAHQIGERSLGVCEQEREPRQDVAGSDGDGQAKLSKKPPEGVQACRAGTEPGGTKAMEGGERLLRNGFDRDRSNFLVAVSLEECLGIRPVRLIAVDILARDMRREQQDPMVEALNFPRPIVGGAASLQEDGRR